MPPVWQALVAVAVATGALAGAAALGGRSRPAMVSATVACWAMWAVMLLAALVPSVAGLAALRALAPLHLVAVIVMWAAGAGTWRGLAATLAAVAAVTAIGAAESGRAMVQASAYGDERRFPLRIPAPLALPIVLSWLVWAAAVVLAVIGLGTRRWVLGTVLAAAGVALGGFLWRRWLGLARRWLVIVPAGLVIHDPVMLGETVMLPSATVRRMELARQGTGSLDLSGPASGHLLDIEAADLLTVLVRRGRDAQAIHARSVLVAPSRPGAALAGWRQPATPPPST